MFGKNCILCDKNDENKKGRFMIVAKPPKNSIKHFPIKFFSTNSSFDISIMTDSVYIGKTNVKMIAFVQAFSDEATESDIVTIEPDEFNYLEIDYEYALNNNKYELKRLILKKQDDTSSMFN